MQSFEKMKQSIVLFYDDKMPEQPKLLVTY